MKQESKSGLQMRKLAAPVAAGKGNAAWTLVDHLFPADRSPVWNGSVSGEPGVVLAKTAWN